MKKTFAANIALLLTAVIWGVSFVAQRAGMEYVEPFTFNTARCLLGGLSLLPVIWIIKLTKGDIRTQNEKKQQHKNLFKGGIVCGLALFLAMSIQQICMQYVPAGKAGFISALYLIFVPVLSIFLGKKLPKSVVVSIIIAFTGLYLLCFKPESAFNVYDGILLISAFFYGVHIIAVGHYSLLTDAAKLSCMQFFMVFLFSLPFMFTFETPMISSIIACKVPLFYAGIVTCGIAYTLQIFGQKNTSPVIASLILSLESVFAVAGGTLILNETMSPREAAGCLLMITAVILSELKFGSKSRIHPQIK